ncbi:transmembrane protein 47-like [Tubulanus polymorphus]|uniref:transmembrane protein 47-like n=1 Tax=Tubulanus polymorphus TaxID=672921 RepID=UPI003DA3B10D
MMNHSESRERMAPTTTIETVTVVRPLKVLAFVCSLIATILLIVTHVSTEWLTTSGYRQGLWKYCSLINLEVTGITTTLAPGTDTCVHHPSDKAWVHASAALCVIGLLLTFAACVLCGVGLALKPTDIKYKLYRVAMYLLFAAVLLMIISLIVFPVMAIQELNARPITRKYWEFNWAYGIAWGATAFCIGGAILLLCDKESEEIYYREKIHRGISSDA